MSYDGVYNEMREYMLTGKKVLLSVEEKSYHEQLCLFSDDELFHYFVLLEYMKNRDLQVQYDEKNMRNIENTTKHAIFMLLSSNRPKHILNGEMARRAAQRLFR